MDEQDFLKCVKLEYEMARTVFPKFNSGHEGYAVIKEELEELWDEVKESSDSRTITLKMQHECIQIAAMAMAFVLDLPGEQK